MLSCLVLAVVLRRLSGRCFFGMMLRVRVFVTLLWRLVRMDEQMHQNKYLHLPVVDESNGTVSGVVNVMEIMQATAGEQGSSG